MCTSSLTPTRTSSIEKEKGAEQGAKFFICLEPPTDTSYSPSFALKNKFLNLNWIELTDWAGEFATKFNAPFE